MLAHLGNGRVLDAAQSAGFHELGYALPLALAPNLVQFPLLTDQTRVVLPVSVQP